MSTANRSDDLVALQLAINAGEEALDRLKRIAHVLHRSPSGIPSPTDGELCNLIIDLNFLLIDLERRRQFLLDAVRVRDQ